MRQALNILYEILKPRSERALPLDPQLEPIINLYISLIYLSLSRDHLRKKLDNPFYILAVSVNLMKTEYFDRIKNSTLSQEANYNLGRFFHSLKMSKFAQTHYQIAIDSEPYSENYNLKLMAAYNLNLLYQETECFQAGLRLHEHIFSS